MAKVLDVFLHEERVGHLVQDSHGDVQFTYSASWLADPEAPPISCALPLQAAPFKRKSCQAFFEGILPEESQRRLIAKNLLISANNDFSMLEKIGGECAGALSFLPAGEKPHPDKNSYHELNAVGLANLLRELPSRPLLAGKQGIRLSLAGVQDKLAVRVDDEKIFIPLNSSPSTHILKPDFGVYKGVIFNEAICLALAEKVGLSVATATAKKVDDIDYLLIKRYDRRIENDDIIRIHQEDFCQALGISTKKKYQREGGPSIKQCLDLLRQTSPQPVVDLGKLVDAVIFNYLIGNCDAHGKNFSLLYNKPLQFAPLYDLVCTLYYENLDQKMAMKLGGEYHIARIRFKQFEALADEIGFSKAEMRRRVTELTDATLAALPRLEIQHPVQERVVSLIKARCERAM